MSVRRWLPLSGVVFVVLVVFAVVVLGGSTPGTNADGDELMSFYDDNEVRQGIAAFVLAASAPFLVFFGVHLAHAASPDGRAPSFWERILAGGSVAGAVAVIVAAFVHFALADAADDATSTAALQALNSLDNNSWLLVNSALGVMMLGAAGSLLARAGRYRTLGWVALVCGVGLFLPFVDFFALLLTFLWIIVTSVMLFRDESAGVHVPAPA